MRISFSKALSLTTALSLVSASAAEAYLAPLSFNEMYAYASQGNLTVINNAILRGMNVNTVNADGDTGICVAIRRNDHLAYNTFKRAGARLQPPCIDNINPRQYRQFMAEQESFEAAYMADDDNTMWWWIGGAAVAGGVALAAGGGGGGGGDAPAPAPEDPEFHSNRGLGYIVGTSEPSEPETLPYSSIIVSAQNEITEVNREALTLSNNANMWVANPDFTYDTVPLADLVNFDADINSYTKYLQVGMFAYNNSEVINDTEQTITLGNGTIGLDAILDSSASNLGTIQVEAQNAAIGMIAGDYSSAGNNGTIAMTFSGKDTSNSLIGMYADTNAEIINNGTISSGGDTVFGKVTGMQTRLTNYYADFVNTAENNGNIELTASGNDAGAMSLWGMSSWLDKAFIDGSKSVENLDKANLVNNGTINLTYSLQPAEEEEGEEGEAGAALSNPITLSAGNGGIVGMHADANTSAVNSGNISLTVTGDAGETLAAGMQAVRGGNLTNGGDITVSAEGSAYGMFAITGSNGGENFASVQSTLINRGDITVTAGDTGYGIYSAVNGDITHDGNIVINGSGYGIFKQSGNVNGNGTITITGTGETGSYGIYAESAAENGHKITNSAVISMTFAPDEEESGGEEEDQPTLPSNYGIYGNGVDIDNSGEITITQKNEKYHTLYGIYANKADITNSATVTLNGAGSALLAYGNIINSGDINMYGNGYGAEARNGNLTNSGVINMYTSGTGLFVTGGNLTNNAAVNLFGNGQGIYASGGNLINNVGGNIKIVADNGGSVSGLVLNGNGYQLRNYASVVFTGDTQITAKATGIAANGNAVTNSGNITLGSEDITFTNAYGITGTGGITNTGSISLFGTGYGIRGEGNIDNGGLITMHAELDNTPVYGIYGENTGIINNHAQINVLSGKSVNAAAVTGIYGTGIQIINDGDIRIGDTGNLFNSATGIMIADNNLSNSGNIRIYGSGAALKGENANITNETGGSVTVVTNGAADSYGIYLSGNGTLTNHAAVKINRSDSYADGSKMSVLFADNADIVNTGSLELGANNENINGNGIEASRGDVNNQGTITVYGDGNGIMVENGSITNNASVSVYGTGSGLNVSGGNIVNDSGGTIYIHTDGGADAYGIYASGSPNLNITNNAAISLIRANPYSQAASTGNYGIWTDNATISNSGDISMGSSTDTLGNIYGLYASADGNIKNSGVITLYSAGTAIYATNGTVNNISTSGLLSIRSDGSTDSYGIFVAASDNDQQISNENRILITAANASVSSQTNIGIMANNVNNSGTIQIGDTSQEISNAYAIKSWRINNSGVIRLYGSETIGLFANKKDSYVDNSASIDLYGNDTKGIYQEEVGSIENSGAITLTGDFVSGIYSQNNASLTNSGVITINGETGYGINVAGGTLLNENLIDINGNDGHGIFANNVTNLTNNGDIVTDGTDGIGLLMTGSSSGTNYGQITVNSEGSTAVKLTLTSSLTNWGKIFVNEANSYGFSLSNDASLTNYAEISVGADNGYGIYSTGNGAITNYGKIDVEGETIYGIYSAGNNSSLKNKGNIEITGSQSSGIYFSGTQIMTNDGDITVDGNNSYGIYSQTKGQVINNGDIKIGGSSVSGIYGSDQTLRILNYGAIVVNGADSYGINTDGGKAFFNEGNITVTGANSWGIYSKNNITNGAYNAGTITMNSDDSYGIAVTGGTVENKGDIIMKGNNSTAIDANDVTELTSSGDITVNGTESYGIHGNIDRLTNTGAVTVNGTNSYGISYASNGTVINSGLITVNGTESRGINITSGTLENSGEIITKGSDTVAIYARGVNSMTNNGNITVNSLDSYGINVIGGTAHNTGDIIVKSSNSRAIFADSVDLTNDGDITVDGTSSYGILINFNTNLTNNGTITVNGTESRGIQALGGSIDNKNTITVNATNGFGIYATGETKVTNTGVIDMNATDSTKLSAAIYATDTATVTNDGELYISGSDNTNTYALYADGNSEIINNADIHVDGIPFASNVIGGSGSITNNGSIRADNQTINLTSNMKFGAKALFAAKEITGTATAAATVVQNNNSDVVVLEDNFRGNTDNLTVVSESYLFDAAYDGKKTTLTRKNFAEVEQNASLAAYLEENYTTGNNTELYNNLKEATDNRELAGKLTGATGRDFVPALAAQSLSLMKDLHRQTNNAWLAADNDERLLAGVSYYDRQNAYGRGISDSDDSAVSFYGLFRNTDNDIWQYGFGLSFTKFDGKFDNDATRDEVIAELMLPMALTTESFDLLGTIYGGYGYGDYKRHAADNRYKGDIKNYYYGVVNELRGKIDSGLFGIVLQPVAEFNVNGVYQRGIDDGALEIRHGNSLSVESGLGLFAEKTFVLDDQNSLRFRVGGTWYHEFNDDYATVKARIAGMDGMFALDPLETEKDRGLISAAGEYKYGAFALYGETAYDTGNGGNWMFNAGLKYAF